MRKKVTTDLWCEIAVDRKIIPFERVPDHAGGNYSASLCGVHLTPRYLHSAQVSRGVSQIPPLRKPCSPRIAIVVTCREFDHRRLALPPAMPDKGDNGQRKRDLGVDRRFER